MINEKNEYMKSEYRYYLRVICFFVILWSLCLTACVKSPVQTVPEKEKTIVKPLEPVEKKEDEFSKPSVIQALSAEAEKFFSQKNFKDALSIYDQLLLKVNEEKQLEIISKIESVLSKTPTKDLEEWSGMKDVHIPKALILYFLGLNHALENNPGKSKEALEIYISQYPDHYYYYEALDLLDTVKKSIFSKDTIGCLLPLTGKYAAFGQRALTGIQLAVHELSNKYSREFKIIVFDTQADSGLAIEGVRQLYQSNVAAIIGPLLMEGEAGKEAEKLKIPMIALTQKTDFPLQGDYLFANFINPEMQVQVLGNYIFSNLGIKKVAILYPDEKYGIKYMELFLEAAREYGGEIVGIEPYDGKKTNFTVPIKKLTEEFSPVPGSIDSPLANSEGTADLSEGQKSYLMENEDETELSKRKKADTKSKIHFQALFIPDSPSRVSLILSQFAFNDARDIYLIGTNLWHDESFLKIVKGYNKKVIIPDGFLDSSQNPVTGEFSKNFESLFNHKPQFLEAISYDTASILFITAMDEDVDSREALKNALKKKRIYEGVTGHTMFDEQGIAHRPLFLMTVKNGEFVEITQ
ncbi:MAG: hypothetical protein A2277_01225 [Desulfobacterales bacterium RIFOXYA12_FULL_46_15]|nr:MAG: hypothetical protein A2277_01225 [Desulfobacterales bacterium RIFOXYA12_FULL_46_15]